MSLSRAAQANNEINKQILEESDNKVEAVGKIIVANQVSNYLAIALVPVAIGYFVYSGLKAIFGDD